MRRHRAFRVLLWQKQEWHKLLEEEAATQAIAISRPGLIASGDSEVNKTAQFLYSGVLFRMDFAT